MKPTVPEDRRQCSACDCGAYATVKVSESVWLCAEHERDRKAGVTIPVRSPVLTRVPTPDIPNARRQAEIDAAEAEAAPAKDEEADK